MARVLTTTLRMCTRHTVYMMNNAKDHIEIKQYQNIEQKIVCVINGCKKEATYEINYRL